MTSSTTLLAVLCMAFQACTTAASSPTTPDELSLLTRYAGMGYNALEANPEGDFNRGGDNPGIKRTQIIFEHTYCDNTQKFYNGRALQVPDQVVFSPKESCNEEEITNAFSGQTSYRNELSESVQIDGKCNIATAYLVACIESCPFFCRNV